MIDLKILRDDPQRVRDSQKVRGENPAVVDQLLTADEARRAAISAFETLRAEQNVLSKSVGAAKGDEKTALLEKAKDLSAKVKAAEAARVEAEATADALLLQIHNLIDPAAPVGGCLLYTSDAADE